MKKWVHKNDEYNVKKRNKIHEKILAWAKRKKKKNQWKLKKKYRLGGRGKKGMQSKSTKTKDNSKSIAKDWFKKFFRRKRFWQSIRKAEESIVSEAKE